MVQALIENRLNVLAGVIGLAFGALYAISGFADAGKTDDLSKNQRVKNLLWLLGGAGAVLFGDWKLLSSTEIKPPDHVTLLACYLLGALLAAFGCIALISFLIALTIRARGIRRPQFRGRIWELVLEYMTYGYRYYRARLENLDKETVADTEAAQSVSELGKAVATVMATTAFVRRLDEPKQREIFIDQVLKAMEDTVKLFAAGVADLRLQTNYMIRVSAADLRSDAKPLFVDEPLTDYDGFLVVRRYRDGKSNPTCIPLETAARATRVLPGAPMCWADRTACHLNTRKLNFNSGVPSPIKAQVKDFFKDAPYDSVLSVPLILERNVVGVVNVESNRVDVVDKGADMVGRIGDALAPFCVILGDLVLKAEAARAEE